MSAKGKGRGRAAFTFDIGEIGFSRGDALPESAFQPSPLFPSTDFKPVPLKTGEDEDYMLALKQELRGTMKRMPYFIGKDAKLQTPEKYSSKYQIEKQKKLSTDWIPDWRQLPKEMKPRKKTRLKVAKKKASIPTPNTNVDIMKKIEELEKKGDEEKSDGETEGKEKKEEEEAEEEAEVYNEEEQEEENDYIASYFEDGDEFEGSDDNMDEATY
ncbi:DNA-directed RNA polymerase III subunit RPC7 isoform X1 [Rhinatrema bivittatum]|uniref:DNA-directed RNA polymerase III subunit RPC7 isoform X1 n=1 Tax=Rhinatrema bivittatum TaxID=194408 RepID=UPI0011282FA7|nr:DNA-directed RNA polymerase III subunit RPC7 isoform X1 [Rhinatrema bivittatum]XP_029429293.1 DNA-directed RNA polymerase III subunit RPC7 isoform X1 [Rhinatrema bivittatum]XP_029429300.1 DNA-directed RNA polymerase III subunit RPC7 isoform X1 [Rhinatrema bivittatum]XP_029429307.1 DNA-directed RNA polymerase III subunit RPC7 isoform X1 [Rhinatrema bivittatum]XP_029429316.1 DNA-directed RNA polymerase III subunit RPC7 isoform X1 [Rhinatrema bivittatum]XP_029429324.1 DNA-directed RNA polymera